MANEPPSVVAIVAILMGAIVATAAVGGPGVAQTLPKCDPVDPVADAGWSVVPSLETVGKTDGIPYQAGADADWFVDRTTTLLPFCNYYNEIGIYSMRSYTLTPEVNAERIQICERTTAGGSAALSPYAGPCPPK